MSSLQHVIDGADVAGGTERIDVVNPATGAVVGSVPAGTGDDVDRAVTAARAAFPGWSATPVADRTAVVKAISDGISERAGEIADTITAEMGSPITRCTRSWPRSRPPCWRATPWCSSRPRSPR